MKWSYLEKEQKKNSKKQEVSLNSEKYFRDEDRYEKKKSDRYEERPKQEQITHKRSMYSSKPTISSSMGPSAPPTSFGKEFSSANRPV